MFTSVLIANRGEIAVRIARTLRSMGIRSVLAASVPDRRGLAARTVDEVVVLEGYSAAETYLNGEAVITAARSTGCQAIHPGYGFLSERADFAERCSTERLVFIGPPPGVIRALGDKSAARILAAGEAVPVIPGWDGPDDQATMVRQAAILGFPLMVKARGGGGGRGMRVVDRPDDLPEALESARREAESASGDPGLLLERVLDHVHHVEIQILADADGHYVHLGERDCSVQRRRQKIVEESPSPVVDEELRSRLTDSALRIARAAGYVNAGTVEFLVGRPGTDGTRPFWFLEVNPRLQVEHPVTEMVTGLDLVELQLRVAAGEPLPFAQGDIRFEGHAIEFRVNAEDPLDGFRPSTGRIARFWSHEDRPHQRQDAGISEGDLVPVEYDSLIAKTIMHESSRDLCIERASAVIGPDDLRGVRTNLGLLRAIAADSVFRQGSDVDTAWLERCLPSLLADVRSPVVSLAAAAVGLSRGTRWYGPGAVACWIDDGSQVQSAVLTGNERAGEVVLGGAGALRWTTPVDRSVMPLDVRVGDARLSIWPDPNDSNGVVTIGHNIVLVRPSSLPRRVRAASVGTSVVTAPLAGTIAAIRVSEGDSVSEGQLLAVLEAMKMEHRIVAPADGTVKRVAVRERDVVRENDVLVEFQ